MWLVTHTVWQSGIGHAIMSAIGLLYVAVGAALASGVPARGLLSGSAVPVWGLIASTCG